MCKTRPDSFKLYICSIQFCILLKPDLCTGSHTEPQILGTPFPHLPALPTYERTSVAQRGRTATPSGRSYNWECLPFSIKHTKSCLLQRDPQKPYPLMFRLHAANHVRSRSYQPTSHPNHQTAMDPTDLLIRTLHLLVRLAAEGGRVRKGKIEAKVKVTSPLVDAVSGRTPATPRPRQRPPTSHSCLASSCSSSQRDSRWQRR